MGQVTGLLQEVGEYLKLILVQGNSTSAKEVVQEGVCGNAKQMFRFSFCHRTGSTCAFPQLSRVVEGLGQEDVWQHVSFPDDAGTAFPLEIQVVLISERICECFLQIALFLVQGMAPPFLSLCTV